MKNKFFAALIIFIFFIYLFIFHFRPLKLPLFEKPDKADLIVVLEGDYYIRIDKAFELAREGYADTIYCPGLFLPENLEYLDTMIEKYPKITFISDKTGKNTYNEALLTKQYINNKAIDSILLVTSDYHSRRAKITFNMVLDNVKIISVPAKIWTNPKYDYVYRTEMIRIIGALILYWPEFFK